MLEAKQLMTLENEIVNSQKTEHKKKLNLHKKGCGCLFYIK